MSQNSPKPVPSRFWELLSKLRFEAEPEFRPALQDGELVIREGRAERARFMSNAGWGWFILTDRRLIWHEPAIAIWNSKWQIRELNLADISAVDRGNAIHFLLGGRRLRIRLRDGKTEYLFQGGIEDELGVWITAIRQAIGEVENSESAA